MCSIHRLLAVLVLVSAANNAASAANSICTDALECTYKNGTVYDRQTNPKAPKCLYFDTDNDIYLCRKLQSTTLECPDGYTLCGKPVVSDTVGPDEEETTVTSGSGSPQPTTTTNTPKPTQAPTQPVSPVAPSPPQTAQVLNGTKSDTTDAIPSWLIISLGVGSGVALAVFGGVMYKRRRDALLLCDANTITPHDDGSHGYNKRGFFTPAGRRAPQPVERESVRPPPPPSSGLVVETIAPPPPRKPTHQPRQSRNDRRQRRLPRQLSTPTMDTNTGPLPPFRQPAKIVDSDFDSDTNIKPLPPFRQPAKIVDKDAITNRAPHRKQPAPLRDSYSTMFPQNYENARSKAKSKQATPKPVPSFKPAERGWGAAPPSPPPRPPSPLVRGLSLPSSSKTRNNSWDTVDFHDSELATHDRIELAANSLNDSDLASADFTTESFKDEYATSDGCAWLDTNYNQSPDLYTANPWSDAANKAGAGRDSDFLTRTQRRYTDETNRVGKYPDTSMPTVSGGGVTMRDTGYRGDKIVDLSRRDPEAAPAFARKHEAKEKVAKWKNKYMAL